MARAFAALIWLALACAVVLPLAVAAESPLLAWRRPVYIVAGFAAIVAMALLLVQPLLAVGDLPGLKALRGRRAHRWIGAALVAAIVVHVGGLWITSPPDVIDALTFTSATPFSVWGVLAMWAVFAAAILALLRRRMRPRLWRTAHLGTATIIVTGSVIHALMIEGTMGPYTKAALCALAGLATARAVHARWPRPAARA